MTGREWVRWRTVHSPERAAWTVWHRMAIGAPDKTVCGLDVQRIDAATRTQAQPKCANCERVSK